MKNQLSNEKDFLDGWYDKIIPTIDEKFYRFLVNTVGSGDSTVAGIATGVSRRLSISDSIRLGMAAGISNTQFESTGIVSTKAVKDFYKKIMVLPIN